MEDLLDRAYDMLQEILSKQAPDNLDKEKYYGQYHLLMTIELESRIRQLLEDINDDIYSRL
jgi:hypothetical protein